MNTVPQLDAIVHELLDRLRAHPFGARLHAGMVTREEYAAFLVQTYHYVLHTRPLLARAGERLARQGETLIAQLFLRKAEEENGHEQWVLDDLCAIGENRDIVKHIAPVPAVQTFVAWNSFVVEHGSPIALLGAAYVLEAVSGTHAGIVAKNLIDASGICGITNGVRFLRGHADADVDHVASLGQVIEAMVSSPEDRDDLVTTAHITHSTYAGLYSALALGSVVLPPSVDIISAPGNAPQAWCGCRSQAC